MNLKASTPGVRVTAWQETVRSFFALGAPAMGGWAATPGLEALKGLPRFLLHLPVEVAGDALHAHQRAGHADLGGTGALNCHFPRGSLCLSTSWVTTGSGLFGAWAAAGEAKASRRASAGVRSGMGGGFSRKTAGDLPSGSTGAGVGILRATASG